MQTFVPIATDNFIEIAKTLDSKRLHKQALEGWQILMVLTELDPQGNPRIPKGWVNHPAVKMWRGHEGALLSYIQAMVVEWKQRGYKSTIDSKAEATYQSASKYKSLMVTPPQWMVDQQQLDTIASTHRQALLVKDYEWYSQFGWPEDPGYAPKEYEYIWPI